MARLRLNISMSLDGYVAGPNQSLENPLGEGGEALHEWALATRSFRRIHGGEDESGETGVDDDVMAESFANLGASIMGRNMFGGGPGPWSAEPWKGWWGDDPPFHHPVFVLTNHAREPLEMRGGTTFYFVTDGIEAALERAKQAAGDGDVGLGGGAEAARQYVRAGLVDDMQIHVAPVLLGGGARLFEDVGDIRSRYEPVGLVSSPAVAHYRYRRVT
jgi:dihydrofolate reductase